jgi:hypothetical protein
MATLALEILPREVSPGRRAFARLGRRRAAMAGLVVVVFFVALALFAPFLAPYDPLQTSWSAIRKAPSAAHWFGTDEIGRDVLSRVIYGTRASLLAGLVSVCIALSFGVPIGLLAGYAGRWPDALISRMTDAMLATPFLILAIALAAFLGPSLTNAMIAIGVSATPIFIRLTRAQVLSVKVEDYVEAARAVGGARCGQFAFAYRRAAHPAQRRAAADRAGDARDRGRSDRRGQPLVLGPWATAAGTELGQHAQHRQELRRERAVDGRLAGGVDFPAGALVQPAGRRPARRARSAAVVVRLSNDLATGAARALPPMLSARGTFNCHRKSNNHGRPACDKRGLRHPTKGRPQWSGRPIG